MIQLYLKRTARLLVWILTLQLRERLRERRAAAVIRASGLFDAEDYLRRYPDVADVGLDPVVHFVRHGAAELRNPHPLFETRYYLEANTDVAEANVNPLVHFLLHGAHEERRPNPLFDIRYYLDQRPEVRNADGNALLHYLEHGHEDDASPHPLFNQNFYRQQYPEIVKTGQNPLVHFLRKVESETVSVRGDPAVAALPVPQPAAWPSSDSLPQLIAFYLPQFHPIAENDEWWGTGFTEWTNVSAAKPLYPGHDQPRLAGELGYYDLRLPEVRNRQAALAREYGIAGFCYYYYWFEGRKVLERPVSEVVASGEPDFPFCICWANENWTRRWDGLDDDILLRQEHSLRSDFEFIKDILPVLKDPRYITVDGSPLLLVYRPDKIQDPRATSEMWRDAALQAGLPGLHLCGVQFRVGDPRPLGFDAAVEFPPHHFPAPPIRMNLPAEADAFEGKLLDYGAGAANALQAPTPAYVQYRGIIPSWDNTARNSRNATVLHGATPKVYEEWLTRLIDQVVERGGPSSRFVFINAWNEWAEGAYLEPDQRHERSYLEATARALASNKEKLRQRHEDIPHGQDESPAAQADTRAAALPTTRRAAKNEGRVPLLVVGHDAAAAGSQYVLLELLGCLREESGFEPHLVLQAEGALLPAYRECVETQVLGEPPEPGSDARAQFETRIEALKREGLTTALCNTVVTAEAAKLCKQHGLEVVSLVHEQPDSIETLFGGDATMDLLKGAADRIVVVSHFARDALIARYGEMGEGLVVVPPPLRRLPAPAQTRTAMRNELLGRERSQRGDCLVLGCGTLYARKAPDLFIEVAREVAQRPGDCRCAFVWAGGGLHEGDVEAYNQRAREAGVSDLVTFLGSRDDIAGLLQAADIFALTSREDPFPLVNMEALSCGLPVVAFEGTGGAPELIEDDAGIVVPKLDVVAMAHAVQTLAGDAALRAEMGNAGRKKMSERFTPKRYTEQLLEHISRTPRRSLS